MVDTTALLRQTAALRELLDTAESAKAEDGEGLDPGGLPEGAAVQADPAAQGDDGKPSDPKGEDEDEDEDEEEGEEEGEDRPPKAPGDDGQLGDEEAKNSRDGYKSDDDVAVIDANDLISLFTQAVTDALKPVTKALSDIAAAHTVGIEATKAVVERAEILAREPRKTPNRPGVAVTNGYNPASTRMAATEATKSVGAPSTQQEREGLVMPAVFSGKLPLPEAQHFVNKGSWPAGFSPSTDALEQITAAKTASTTGQ